MTHSHSGEHANKASGSGFWSLHPAPFIDSLIDAQRQALEYAAELGEAWMTRTKSESELATNLVSKLAAARSLPDAASAWQECIQRQMQLNAQDTRRVLAQNEKFLRISSEILSSGGTSLT